jgi:hypothetical protein
MYTFGAHFLRNGAPRQMQAQHLEEARVQGVVAQQELWPQYTKNNKQQKRGKVAAHLGP